MPIRKLPSAGFVVGVIAIILTLGGTAVAAKLITGKQIKNGSIQAKDLSKKVRSKLAATGGAGQTGAAGVAGNVGPAGPAGPVGPQGPTGAKGADGGAGPKGADGAPGAKGDKGDPSTAGRFVEDVTSNPVGLAANTNTEIAAVELDVPDDAKYAYVAGSANFSLASADANVVLWVTANANCTTQNQPAFDSVPAMKQISVSNDNMFETPVAGNKTFRLCARSSVAIQPGFPKIIVLTVADSGLPVV